MDGILIVKKEKGCTSHDVVAKVKRITKTKVGHTGTLDPMATGVLPLLIGEGTKISKYLVEHDKIYEAVVQLGEKTTTGDGEGKVIERKEVDSKVFENDKINEVFKSIKGKQKQKPPIYSAIKVKGRKLYEYARDKKMQCLTNKNTNETSYVYNNEKIDIPEREIEIYDIELIEHSKQDKTISFRVHCSKGTYIRSLCEDIAEKLNTVGYMKELNRIKVGSFTIEQAVSINELEANIINNEEKLNNIDKKELNKVVKKDTTNYTKILNEHITTIEEFFKDKPSITLRPDKLKLFLNGVKLNQKEIKAENFQENELYKIYDETGEFIGLGVIEKELLKRDVIIEQ